MLAACEPRDVEVEGLVFREVLSVTQHPRRASRQRRSPTRATATLNFRYAPRPLARRGRGAAARARRRRRRDRSANSPAAPVAARNPLVERLRDVGGFDADAEAGVDARRPVRGARARRGELRPRRDAVRAHAGRAGRDRGARAVLRGAPRFASLASRRARLPRSRRQADYPFVRLEEAKRRARRARASS